MNEEVLEEPADTTGILSPEGFVMMSVAITLDLVSIIPGVNVITDAIGLIVIGSWMFFRAGTIPQGKGSAVAQKTGSKTLRRFTIAGIVEFIPVISILPWWTITVYQELTS